MPSLVTDILGWSAIALLLGGVLANSYTTREQFARTSTTLGWGLFGVFWAALFPYYAFDQTSLVEGALTALALPLCAYTGYLLYTGRTSLFILSRAVAVMGLIYLPAETIPVVRQVLIETTTTHTEWLLGLLGYHPTVERGTLYYDGYRNTFVFPTDDPTHNVRFIIRMACTGLGSIAIFGGLVAAAPGTVKRKLTTLGLLVPTIYALNIVRTTFISITYGYQKFHIYPDLVMRVFGLTDPYAVSYIIADRILGQLLSVVALIILALVAVRQLPGLLTLVDEVLYIVTGTDYQLAPANQRDDASN